MANVVISLDGAWWLATDAANIGRDEGWQTAQRTEARAVHIPSIIQEYFPAYHGVVWYWRHITPPAHPHPGGRALLRFGAVDYMADVWVNGIHVGGHEGGETPFTLDITSALDTRAEALIAVRVLNPTTEPIDGVVLAQTPHRNKAVPHYVGGSYNSGGIIESVELTLAPAIHITDIHLQPDLASGEIDITVTAQNTLAVEVGAMWDFDVTPSAGGAVLIGADLACILPAGESTHHQRVRVTQPHLWDLHDPYLYRVSAQLNPLDNSSADEISARCGFRDFRVINGFFHLNGRRIFLRSTHTGNHCPIGQVIPPATAPDLLQRDLIYAKASGFNMVRFISGVAHPWQLDMCDEIGLMVYEECYAGWCLEDSPHMARRFDLSVREMVLRDRNHPSVTIWGMLNETFDGPVFRHAVDALQLVRAHDTSRLALLGSGRWDCQPAIGSVSNPGSTVWEHVWGAEAPDAPPTPTTWNTTFGGYFNDAGDAHVYPGVPHPPSTAQFLRNLGGAGKPVFLSEYGIGSALNAIRELRHYEQAGVNLQAEDALLMRSMAERFIADWKRYGMDGVYAFPEDMLRDSQRLHARQRLLGFDAIRSNPNICGYNLTGMLDHGMTGEGLWTFWREWKPGIVDALSDGWAPLRWCAFVEPMHGYAGRPISIEVALANEDALPPGTYPALARIIGPQGIAWERRIEVRIPDTPAFAVPVLMENVTLPTAGEYEFAITLERGGAPAGGRMKFRLSAVRKLVGNLVTWGITDATQAWLQSKGVSCATFNATRPAQAPLILLGDLTTSETTDAQWRALWKRAENGATVVALSPLAFKHGDDTTARLPLTNRGRCYAFNDWLYHKECVAKSHEYFNRLHRRGVMDWDYYGQVIGHYLYAEQDTPDDVAAAAFAVGYSCPGGYASGVLLGSYKLGEGRLVLNTFNILENLGQHPAADELMANMISSSQRPS